MVLHGIPKAQYKNAFRYIVAHDGDVLNADPAEEHEATDLMAASSNHQVVTTVVLGPETSETSPALVQVVAAHPSVEFRKISWVWDCVRAGKLLP